MYMFVNETVVARVSEEARKERVQVDGMHTDDTGLYVCTVPLILSANFCTVL